MYKISVSTRASITKCWPFSRHQKGVALCVRPRIRYNNKSTRAHTAHQCMGEQTDGNRSICQFPAYMCPSVRSFVYSIIHSFIFFVTNFHRLKYRFDGSGANCLDPLSWYYSDFAQFIFLWKSKCDIDSLIDVNLSAVIDWSSHSPTYTRAHTHHWFSFSVKYLLHNLNAHFNFTKVYTNELEL